MAETTLTLYKNTKLDDLKNFKIDDIETYLSNKSTQVITKFQYVKFLLNMSIKIDKDQAYLLKSSSLNRWDYCKISIVENNTTINYYYFILRAAWKAESTIQLELKMDTLNTYKLSNVEADDSYVLSNKTLVLREHKDRLKFLENRSAYKDETPEAADVSNIQSWKGETSFTGSFTIKFDFVSYFRAYNESTPLLTFPVNYSPNDSGTSVIILDDKGQVVDTHNFIHKIWFESDHIRVFLNANDFIDYYYDDPSIQILFNIVEFGGTAPTFSNPPTWNFINPYFLEDKVYVTTTYKYYERIINQFEEGIGSTLFKNKEDVLYDKDGVNQWYVVFASVLAVTTAADDTEAKYVNPVAIRYYSDFGYDVSTASAKLVTFYAKDLKDYDNYAEYILLNRETLGTGYFIYNGVTYYASDLPTNAVGFSIRRDTKLAFSYLGYYSYNDFGRRYEWSTLVDSTPASFIRFYGINEIPVYKASGSLTTAFYNASTKINIGSGVGALTGTCKPWNQIDLTSPLLIKAFAFPYVPVDYLEGKTSFDALPSNDSWSSDGECLEVLSPQEETFDRNIQFEVDSPFNKLFIEGINPSTAVARDKKYESKLLHSDYYQTKFVYDSFAFSFNLEDVDASKIESYDQFRVQYVVSKNVVSKFAFIFNQYVCKRETQNYNNVLTIERNNEKALYNNAYINYIRSGGYSFDTKKASSQNAMNGITTALSIVGSVGSVIGGWATMNPLFAVSGVAAGAAAIASIGRTIHTAQEQDRAIGQKLNQTILQGTSVQGSEDIDILTAFSDNKAKLVYYELSDIMKNAMWDLFHYCGYATHEQKVPDVTTRLYFNFVQAEIVFEEFSFDEDIADDIRNKWKQGVTFFHKVNGGYDIDQQYENFETSLL